MTQLWKDPDSISNYFDRLERGVGHRGSSFSDIDAISHDGASGRFLVREFKNEGEPRTRGQHWMLEGLSRIPKHFTVWVVERRSNSVIGFAIVEIGRDLVFEAISEDEYRRRVKAWWNQTLGLPEIRRPDVYDARERMVNDPILRDFVDAEIARAHVELQALRVEAAHWTQVAHAQAEKADTLQKELRKAKKG